MAAGRPGFAAGLLAGVMAFFASPAFAQLKDETPAERDAMIMATLLPGVFSNGEQRYFDERLQLPAADRAAATQVSVTRVVRANGLPPLFVVRYASGPNRAYTLSLDAGATAVRMNAFTLAAEVTDAQLASGQSTGLTADLGCNLTSRREAGQFRATAAGPCTAGPQELMLTPANLWWKPSAAAPFSRLNRARQFECYVDMPGSGGLRGEAFNRYSNLLLDDQGTEAWFTTKEAVPRKLGLRLRNVDWPMNNKAGTYTRDSLTLYLVEAGPDGAVKNLAYAWTEPQVRRIGLNTVAALANCYMDSPTTAQPEF
jgi:hypothetical protein